MKTIVTPTSRGSSGLRRRTLRVRPLCMLPMLAVLFAAVCFSTQLSAGMVFENGFEEGAADWDADGPWQPAPANASSSNISREGAKSVRFQTIPSDPNGPLTKRSEFTLANGFGHYDWNTEYWVGFSVRIIQPNDGFGHIIQHHSKPRQGANGQPDWTYVSGENSFTLDAPSAGFVVRTATDPSKVNGETAHGHVRTQTGNSSWGTVITQVIPYELNRWYDFVLHFRLAPNNTGIMEVWMKDTVTDIEEKLVNVVGGVTVYAYDSGKIQAANPAEWVDGQPKTPKNEQKIGLYYGAGKEAIGGDILIDAFRIWEGPGGSKAAVAPRDDTPPPPSPPAAPSNVAATADSSSQVTVTWTDNASDETGFRIQRKLGASGTYADTVPATVGSAANTGSTVTFPDTNGLSGGNTYFYQVRADKAGSSSSAYVAMTTGVTTPTGGGETELVPVSSPASTTWDEAGANGPDRLWDGVSVDGGNGSRWASNASPDTLATAPRWVVLDLGASYNLTKFVLYPYQSRAYHYEIHASADGVSWGAALFNIQQSTGAASYTHTLAAPVTARYVRLTVDGISGSSTTWASINEFDIFGAAGSNTPPEAVGDSYAVAEDGTLNVAAAGVLANDQDAESNPLTAVLVTGPAHASSFTLSANGSFTYTPVANYDGPDSFTYKANDGMVDSTNAATVTLTVNAVNDPPTLDSIADVTILEDAGAQNVSLTGIGAGGGETQTLAVGAASANAGVIPTPTVAYTSPNATGSLSFTPVANANGSVVLSATVNDGQTANNTVTRNFTVTITPVNDAPSFTKGANQTVTAGAGAQTVVNWATGFTPGPADESAQTVAAYVVTNDNNPLFTAQPSIASNGTLTYTPVASVAAPTTATVTVQVRDNGGTANGGNDISSAQTFTITVNPAVGGDPIVIDFNSYLAGATTSGDSVGSIGLTGASNNDAVRFLANSANDFVNFSIPASAIPAGTYAVSVRVRKANSMGKYQMSIDGSAQGTEQNLYSSGGTFEVLNLGTVQLSGANDRELQFTCTDKDPASSNYTLTLDTLTLSP